MVIHSWSCSSAANIAFLILIGNIVDASRLKILTPAETIEHEHVDELAKFQKAEREYDAADEKAGRSRTEVKKMMVYKVQPTSFPFLADSNAADVIGELTFLANDIQVRELKKSNEVIVQHEVEIEVATNPNRAYKHYLRYIGGRPDKDPKQFGIDTVGFKMREIGGEGWLSFPSSLKCSSRQEVGQGCAWKDIERVKTIHTTCLLEMIDDGLKGSMKSFEEVLRRYTAPSSSETFRDFNQKLAEDMFMRAFKECPDVGVFELFPYTHNLRRCCCFHDEFVDNQPLWAKKGVCLKGDRDRVVFGQVWSMNRAKISSEKRRCAEGHSLYTIERNRGRCLTAHEGGVNQSLAVSVSGDPYYETDSDSRHAFEQMVPSLVKSKWSYLGASLWKQNMAFVCPGSLGMRHKNCDCNWAHDVC